MATNPLVDPHPDPGTPAERQEAGSFKYSATTFCVVPLSSGNLALFQVLGNDRKLLRIEPTLDRLFEGHEQNWQRLLERSAAQRERERSTSTLAASLDLSGLGDFSL